MHARSVVRVEKAVDVTASMLFALACCLASYAWFAGSPLQLAWSAAVAALGYTAGAAALRVIEPESRRAPVPIFDVREVEPMGLPELLLTDVYCAPSGNEDALLLDDILAKLGSDSRVVRLFDPAAMPTPGQLNDRIERHLERRAAPISSEDATQALHDALAELRRSIR